MPIEHSKRFATASTQVSNQLGGLFACAFAIQGLSGPNKVCIEAAMSMRLKVLLGSNTVGNKVTNALLLKATRGSTTASTCAISGGSLERKGRIESRWSRR